jgi:hypothetical protein
MLAVIRVSLVCRSMEALRGADVVIGDVLLLARMGALS